MHWWGWVGFAIPLLMILLTFLDDLNHPTDRMDKDTQIGEHAILISLWMLAWMLWWAAWQ